MTRGESERIFKALRRYYPNAKIYSDPDRLEAYRERLLHYDFKAVVAAGKAYVDKNKYFPDLPDLVGGLKPVEPAQTRGIQDWMLPYLNDENEHSVSRYAREHGLTWEEAKLQMEA